MLKINMKSNPLKISEDHFMAIVAGSAIELFNPINKQDRPLTEIVGMVVLSMAAITGVVTEFQKYKDLVK